jgi:hypothetical protein
MEKWEKVNRRIIKKIVIKTDRQAKQEDGDTKKERIILLLGRR